MDACDVCGRFWPHRRVRVPPGRGRFAARCRRTRLDGASPRVDPLPRRCGRAVARRRARRPRGAATVSALCASLPLRFSITRRSSRRLLSCARMWTPVRGAFLLSSAPLRLVMAQRCTAGRRRSRCSTADHAVSAHECTVGLFRVVALRAAYCSSVWFHALSMPQLRSTGRRRSRCSTADRAPACECTVGHSRRHVHTFREVVRARGPRLSTPVSVRGKVWVGGFP